MAGQSEQVAHAGLVSGGQTALHSHAGGGGGAEIKAGTVTTDGSGNATVTFATAFPDANYAIGLAGEGSSDDVIMTWGGKTASGFSVHAGDDTGKNESGVQVLWIATPFANP